MTEYWDLYDQSGIWGRFKRTGETVESGTQLSLNHYHMAVHVWIENSKKEYLFCGSSEKWSIAKGNALAGETSGEAARRIVEDALGFQVDIERGIKLGEGIILPDNSSTFIDVWLFKKMDGVPNSNDNKDTIAWLSADQIVEMIRNKNWDHPEEFPYLDKFPFEDKSRSHEYGSIIKIVRCEWDEIIDRNWNWFQLPELIIDYIQMWRSRFMDFLLEENDNIPSHKQGGITFAYYGESYYLDSTVFGLPPELSGVLELKAEEMEAFLKLIHVWNATVQFSNDENLPV